MSREGVAICAGIAPSRASKSALMSGGDDEGGGNGSLTGCARSVAALRRSSGRRRSATSAALLRFREHKIRRLNSEFLFPYFESLLFHPTGKRSTWRRLCYLLSGSVVRTYEACCPATAEGTPDFFSVINYYDCEPETCRSSIRGSA